MGTNERGLVSGLQQLSNQLPLVTPNNSHRQGDYQTGCDNSGSRANWSAEMTYIPRAVTTFWCKKEGSEWNYFLKVQVLAAVC